MNYTIVIIATILNILLIIRQINVWKFRCLLSPGFYFGVVWVFGTMGTMIFDQVGILINPYPEYIDELNIYIAFTALCFIVFTKIGNKRILQNNNTEIQLTYIENDKIFNILSVMILITSLITWINAGASLNMGESRSLSGENTSNQSVFVGYLMTVSLPLSIIAGYWIGQIISGKKFIKNSQKIFLAIPLIANLIFSIYLGGRVNVSYCVVQYIIGFIMSMPLKINRKIIRKIIYLFIPTFLILSIFISLVSSQRQTFYRGADYQVQEVTKNNVILEVLYGPLEYVNASYIGYQYRRVDDVDLSKKYYGTCTLNGFINWTLPFASQIGLGDVSIAKLCNVYYHNQDTYDFKREYFYTTNSCYIPIIKDFGINGAFFFIIFLSYISHWLFIKIQQQKVIVYSSSLFLYYLFLEYWMKSNYYGTLSNTILSTLYGFLIIDIIKMFTKHKKKYIH